MIAELVLFAALSITDHHWTEESPPRYEDFPVREQASKPVAPDVREGRARRYRTAIREGASEGPNFAGHFTIVHWGCGTCCNEFAIVNSQTGKVFFPDFLVSCIFPFDSRFGGQVGIDGKLNSRLLVITGSRNEKGGGRYFYEWTGSDLEMLLAIEDPGDMPE